jgi:FAD/FMN-containing dehydrogenase
MMRDMVIGLEAVLADGTIVSSLTKMLKDNAGYNWKHLLIGSEGTLGVITKTVLRLRPLPTTNQTALVATASFDKTAQLLRRLEVSLSGRLSSFEVMWDDFYGAMTEAQLSKRPRPLKLGYPIYILLEALGGDPDSDPAQFERVLAAEIDTGLIADAVIAGSERERQALWAVREDMAGGYANMHPCTVFDVSMGLADMAGFVADVRKEIPDRFPGARMLFYGHAGDGNLHMAIHVGKAPRTDEVESAVFDLVRTVKGSVAAEHGIGWTRKPYLGVSRTDAELMLMQKLKDTLDPRNILNPGKIVG